MWGPHFILKALERLSTRFAFQRARETIRQLRETRHPHGLE